MNDHAISGLANPTRPNDAVHKFYVDSLFENLQAAVDAQITQYQLEMEDLQTRVVRLELLSLKESTEPAEASTEAAETVARE